MKKSVTAIILALCLIATCMSSCVVVKIGEEGKLTGEVAFDADTIVAEAWDEFIIPDLDAKKTDLAELLNQANGSWKPVADKGKYTMGTSGDLNFVATGKATVTEIATEKKAGYITLKLEGYDGDMAIQMQVGSVYKGSSVRDSLEFITYEDYTNQVEWANISQKINEKIDKDVITPADIENIKGKTVEFMACFTADSKEKVLLTPVTLTVQ